MADSYIVSHRAEAPIFSVLQPDSAVATDHPYMKHACALGVYNKPGSGKLVKILKAAMLPWFGASATGFTQAAIGRITAYTGGSAVTPLKMDQNATALPAQVTVAKYPSTITTSGSLHRQVISGVANDVVTGYIPSGKRTGGSTKANTDTVFNAWDTSAQPIVLREGEGLAINTGLTGTNASSYPLEVTIDLLVGSDSHRVCEIVSATVPLAWLAVLNGSGSGVIVSVVRIAIHELRYASSLSLCPAVQVERFESMDTATSGEAPESVVALDQNVPLDSNVVVKTGASVATYGASRGAVIAKPLWHAAVSAAYGIIGGSAGSNWALNRYGSEFRALYANDPWVIREGEGIGFFVRHANMMPPLEYQFLFTVEAAPTGGSSGGSWTWQG